VRQISQELLAKIQSRQKTLYNNAQPELKAYFSRGLTTELFLVHTIEQSNTLQAVDVTVKRPKVGAAPNEAYAVCVDDGLTTIKSKPLPYDELTPWLDEFTVAANVTSVAIEFDGYWDRDWKSRRFDFITEEFPWIFYVQGGNLYAQHWQQMPIMVATTVAKISTIRGWLPVTREHHNDQGLIAGYIKTDGLVYYRAYCHQPDGTRIWEVERRVAAITATDIALFRTNDFRIGFLVTVNGAMRWSLTTRNYAGMSIFPDLVMAGLSNISFNVVPIQQHNTFAAERVTTSVGNMALLVCRPITPTVLSIANELNVWRILIKFSHALSQNLTSAAIRDRFTVRDALGVSFAILSTSAGADQTELYLNMVHLGAAKNDLIVTFTSGASDGIPSALTSNNEGCEFNVPSFAVVFTALIEPPRGFASDGITAGVGLLSFVVSQVFYRNTFTDENITASVSHISFVVTRVGGNPL